MNNTKNFLEYIRKSQIRQSAEDSSREGREPVRPVFFSFNWKWLPSEVERMGEGDFRKKKSRTFYSFSLACFRITFHSLAVLRYLIL